MGYNDRLLYESDKKNVFRMLLNGGKSCVAEAGVGTPRYGNWRFAVTGMPELSDRPGFVRELTAFFPKASWKGLTVSRPLERKDGRARKTTPVAFVDTPEGPLIAFRNGWNSTKYNFFIHHKGTTYFRQNVGGAVELVRMLANQGDLPLFVRSRCPENLKLVQSLFRREG